MTVGDELAGDFWPSERRADDPRLAMVKRSHGVPKMCRHSRPSVNCRTCFRVCGAGVSNRRDYAGAANLANEVDPPGKFRRDGHHAYRAAASVEELRKKPSVGSPQIARVLRSEVLRRKERPLEVDASDNPGCREVGERGERSKERIDWRGDETRKVARSPIPPVELARLSDSLRIALGERGSHATVHVEIDESWYDGPTS